MLQGLIAGWIFILFMAALFCDENLRHAMPKAFSDFLAVAVVAIPIWLSIVLYKFRKREKAKNRAVEIKVIE